MTRLFARTLSFSLVFAALPAFALVRGPSTPAAASRLQPLGFLAGSCWKGTFPGRSVTDEHCFEWMYGGAFLRDRHVVRGDSVPYEGETTYAWDAQRMRIVYWYVALPGFHSMGEVEESDGALLFRDLVVGAGGTQSLRTTWRRIDADGYRVRVEDVSAAPARELWAMEMRRSRDAAVR